MSAVRLPFFSWSKNVQLWVKRCALHCHFKSSHPIREGEKYVNILYAKMFLRNQCMVKYTWFIILFEFHWYFYQPVNIWYCNMSNHDAKQHTLSWRKFAAHLFSAKFVKFSVTTLVSSCVSFLWLLYMSAKCSIRKKLSLSEVLRGKP